MIGVDRMLHLAGVGIGLLMTLLALGIGGCSPGEERPKGEAQPPPTPALRPEDYPKLARSLFELATAPQPEKLSEQANVVFQDGLVQVVLELESPDWTEDLQWAIEALGGRVQTHAETLVQAWVPVEALLKLATHPRVVYIRPPMRPKKD